MSAWLRERAGPDARGFARRALAGRRPAGLARAGRALAALALATAITAAASQLGASGCAVEPDAQSGVLEGRVVGISDGDTLTLLVGEAPVRVRLAQIDAPELSQPYGRKAKRALSRLAFEKWARVEVVDVDSYERTVGEVFVDAVHVNREMVREGHAWAYTRYARSTEIIELEDAARAAKRGLWSLPESQREAPWIWRHRAPSRNREVPAP